MEGRPPEIDEFVAAMDRFSKASVEADDEDECVTVRVGDARYSTPYMILKTLVSNWTAPIAACEIYSLVQGQSAA